MDILYVYREGASTCNGCELKYSLRSIEQYGKNVGRVFVVGYCPEWLSSEVIKIPCEDYWQEDNISQIKKNQNIARKILYTIEHSDIGEEFLVSMDDHFYVRKVDFDNYPYYISTNVCGGNLPKYKISKNQYQQFLCDCRKYLENKGLPTLYFTLHRNMHISRKAVEECKDIIQDCLNSSQPMELMVTLNNYRYSKGEIIPTPTKDVKIYNGGNWWQTSPNETEVFSTGDFKEDSGLHILLKGMFNKKSKYEL